MKVTILVMMHPEIMRLLFLLLSCILATSKLLECGISAGDHYAHVNVLLKASVVYLDAMCFVYRTI